jgi:hypothetical protein
MCGRRDISCRPCNRAGRRLRRCCRWTRRRASYNSRRATSSTTCSPPRRLCSLGSRQPCRTRRGSARRRSQRSRRCRSRFPRYFRFPRRFRCHCCWQRRRCCLRCHSRCCCWFRPHRCRRYSPRCHCCCSLPRRRPLTSPATRRRHRHPTMRRPAPATRRSGCLTVRRRTRPRRQPPRGNHFRCDANAISQLPPAQEGTPLARCSRKVTGRWEAHAGRHD